jgi:hypothetical protein
MPQASVNATTAREPGLLDDVVHFVAPGRAQQPHDDHAEPGRVPQMQLVKRTRVSPGKPADQRRIGELREEAAARHTTRVGSRREKAAPTRRYGQSANNTSPGPAKASYKSSSNVR